MKVKTRLIPINKYNHPAGKSTCEEIAIHYTGDLGATAENLVPCEVTISSELSSESKPVVANLQ